MPPPTSANRHSNVNTRYSRELLLTLFQEQRETEDLSGNLADLYAGENDTNDHFDPANKKWGRRDDGPNESAIGPEVCLNNSSTTEPLVLYGMTDEEKEVRDLGTSTSDAGTNLMALAFHFFCQLPS